ncbi:hypothetical protein J6W34_00060 [bacterium]|nr:hypothetical protein [bacterium]
MNYVNFKKYVNAKLNSLKEDLVRDINIPENTLTYDGVLGSYIINPFSSDMYSFQLVFNSEDSLKEFIESIEGDDDTLIDVKVTNDGIHNNYIVDGFFNKGILEEIQIAFKNILNGK